MRRRRLISLLAGATVACPLPLRAQPSEPRPRLGILIYSTPEGDAGTKAFLGGLRDLGYVDRQNIEIEYRYAESKLERIPERAAELVRLKPDVLFSLGGDVTPALSNATKTIPIIYAMSADPVQLGLAASLTRPGGNATGVTFLSDALAAKRLEILKEVAPRISRVAFFWNPTHADNELAGAKRSAAAIGAELQLIEIRGSADLEGAFSATTQAGVDAVYVVSSRHTVANLAPIVDFATKNQLPLAGGWGAWAQAGGLVSYGPNVGEMVRQSALYVDKILKGAKPGELPVMQPTHFELVINLKTAKGLGLSIPESLLLRADKVIE